MRVFLILVSLFGVSLAHAEHNDTQASELVELQAAETFGLETDFEKFLGVETGRGFLTVYDRCDRYGNCESLPGRPGRPGRPGYPPPSRPGYPPGRPYPPPPRPIAYYECHSQDDYGYIYRAIDREPRWAQDEAVRECLYYSPRSYCPRNGCRRY